MSSALTEPTWEGGRVTSRATCLLAPNPSPLTLDGTNTWVLAEPGATRAIVVDPGPADEGHLQAICTYLTAHAMTVSLTLLTHGHPDHAEGAARFAELTGAQTLALNYDCCQVLSTADEIEVDGLRIQVVATPGHTQDSVSFLLPAEGSLLTGDTVLGRGTAVIYHPEGQLEAYLASLEHLATLTNTGQVGRLLPGHGPALHDADAVIRYYLAHRAERLDQVRQAIVGRPADTELSARTLVEIVYADVSRTLWPAAERSVLAQLAYLREHGEIPTEVTLA